MSNPTRHILIADDSPDDRVEIRRLLLTGSDTRYRFTEIADGRSTIDAVMSPADARIDCLILDFDLPDMQATAVLEALRTADGGTRCPVIVLTGSVSRDLGRAMLRAGAQDFIGKDWLSAPVLTRSVENATERWQLMRELAASEQEARHQAAQLRSIYANAPVGLAFVDRDLRHHSVNDTLAAINGVSATGHIGRTVRELLPALADAVEPLYRHAIDTGEPLLGIPVSGTTPADPTIERHWTSGYAPVKDEGGAVIGAIGMAFDVTEMKRAERALRRREVELQTLADNSPDILVRFDRGLRHVFVNKAVERSTGMPREAFLNKTNRELGMPHELCELWDAATRGVFERNEPAVIEFDYVRGDGDVRRFVARLVPELDSHGAVEFVLGFSQDVTDQRRADVAVRETRRRLSNAMGAARAGAWSWDVVNLKTDWSPENFLLLGMDPDREPSHDDWLAHVHRDDRAAVLSAVQDAIAKRVPQFRAEYRIDHPRRGTRWLLAVGEVEFDGEGAARWMSGVNLDITERREMEERLRDQDRSKDRFIATLAHELRNPLAPIRTGIDVLRTAPAGGPAARRALEVMERQMTHMVRLVDELLDISRISNGKVELRRRPLALGRVLDDSIELSRPLIDASRHRLTVEVTDTALAVDGDATRLAQIFGNLLSNAAKYTSPGGSIRLEAYRDGGTAVVRVSDDGIGIAADMLPRVFDMFAQVDTALERAQGGLGIGLALARQLSQLHGGTLEAESAGLGRGSRFTVRLPSVGTPDESFETDPVPMPAQVSDAGALRVLVVDDNADAADTLVAFLELGDHEARAVYRGEDAVAAAVDLGAQVVFVDIGLPGMSGYEVAGLMRAEASLAHATLIALTGWGSAEDKRRSAEAGFDHHLTKPVDTADVEKLVAKIQASLLFFS